MKVVISGVELKVDFEHYQEHTKEHPSYRGEAATLCTIRYFADNKLIAVGVSNCHANDNFCKETGRRKALTSALQDVVYVRDNRYLKNVYIRQSESVFSQKERTEFWKTYFARLPKKEGVTA